MQATTPIVTLNVSGTRFHTTRTTLNQSPFFEAMLKALPEGEVAFVDRDADAFRHVLSLLRNPAYAFPKKYLLELEFYGLTHDAGHAKIQSKPAAPAKYTLFRDCIGLWEEGDKAAAMKRPMQVVPMSEALPVILFFPRSFGNLAKIQCSLTEEVEANLKAAGCPVDYISSTRSMLFECDINTQFFVQTDDSSVIKLVNENHLHGMCQNSEKTGVFLAIVPVLKSPKNNRCAAILVVTSFPNHKFQ